MGFDHCSSDSFQLPGGGLPRLFGPLPRHSGGRSHGPCGGWPLGRGAVVKKGDNKNGRLVLGGQKSALLLRCFFVARDCHDVCIYIYIYYIYISTNIQY